MNKWSDLYEHAMRRGGVVVPSDGPRFGIPEKTIRDRARREKWVNRYPGRGVFFLPGCDGSLRAEASAALLAVGQPAWLARETAACLWGLTGTLSPTPIRVLVPHGEHRYDAEGFRLHESRRIDDHDVTVLDDQPITTPGRTVADLTSVHGLTRCRNLAIAGKRKGVLDVPDLDLQYQAMGRGSRGRGKVHRIRIDLSNEDMDSGFEYATRAFLKSKGFKLYPRPFPYRCRDCVIVHLDIVIDGTWVYIECDTFGIHSQEGTFSKDRKRWTQITFEWKPVWVDEDRLENDPEGFLRDLRASVAATSGRPPPVPADCSCRRCSPKQA